MSGIEWRTDVHGMLRGVRYHDGLLESLEFVSGDQLTLKIRATSAELLTARATGLTDAFVELWAGNIISDIFIWRLGEAPAATSVRDGPWNTLFRGRAKSLDEIAELAADVKQRHADHCLLHVLCSYGGTLVAVGRNIEIDMQT